MLLGMSKPVHVLTASATARGIVNMTALAASGEVPGGGV
jgi:malate dehydrogenase (oxaloacetate-decarboxylating)(NADP+)